MLIFLRQIPAHTRIHEITDFIEPALKKSFFNLFGEKGHIEDIKIITLKDNDLNTIEHHGLVTIVPDSAAELVIKRLNRKPFKGRRIAVREYITRTWQNDRRAENQGIQRDASNRREQDRRTGARREIDRRRRNMEVVEDITDKFKGFKNISRKL